MEIEVSLSALTPSQYRPFMKLWRPDPKMLQIFQKISRQTGNRAMRLYFDFQSDKLIKTFSPECPEVIKTYLAGKGFVLEDYVSGTVKDKHNRTMRLGKVLKDPELRKMFEADPSRKAIVSVTKGKKIVCLSMHPYDIAGMSTGRGWTSCMNLDDGINKEYVREDIKHHTLIAYLIDASDRNITRPLSRVLIKRFYMENSKRKFFYGVERVYPAPNDPFISTVQEFVNENVNKAILDGESLEGMYKLQEDLYPDSQTNIFPQLMYPDSDKETVSNIIKTFYPSIVTNMQWDMLIKRFGTEVLDWLMSGNAETSISTTDAETLNTIVLAFKSNLPESQFNTVMAKLSAYAIRGHNGTFVGRVLQQVVINQSPAAAKLFSMQGDFSHMVKRACNSGGIFARKPVEDAYGFPDQYVNLFIRSGLVKDTETIYETMADVCGSMFQSKQDIDFINSIKRFHDVINIEELIEYSTLMLRDAYQLSAIVKSSNPEINYEVTIGSYVTTVILRKMSDVSKQKLIDKFNLSSDFDIGNRVMQEPEFFERLKEGAEVFNFDYTKDPHGRYVFYPTMQMPAKDLKFGVEETIVDAALSFLE